MQTSKTEVFASSEPIVTALHDPVTANTPAGDMSTDTGMWEDSDMPEHMPTEFCNVVAVSDLLEDPGFRKWFEKARNRCGDYVNATGGMKIDPANAAIVQHLLACDFCKDVGYTILRCHRLKQRLEKPPPETWKEKFLAWLKKMFGRRAKAPKGQEPGISTPVLDV